MRSLLLGISRVVTIDCSEDQKVATLTAEEQVENLRKQQGVLAEFGLRALRSNDIDELLQRASELVCEGLETDLVKILELRPGGLLIRAGTNWAPGVVGHAVLGTGSKSPAGYALQTQQPVISSDTSKESRFEIPQILKDHGVKSMINVVIQGEGRAFGVLEVDATKAVTFSQDDINFLQNYANILAAAIERWRVTAEVEEAARRRNIMLRELQHRTKNMLMKIQAIASRTRSSCSNLDEFLRAFNSRLQALGRAQDLLTRGVTDAVSIRELLVKELAAQGAAEGGLTLDGDNVEVPGKNAWALNLLFHELTTNAQKYGALRSRDGKISVAWRKDDKANKVLIHWRESGVNLPLAPSKKSFGSEIIEKIIPDTLGATSTLTFRPDGIEYVIEFPVSAANS